MFFCGTFVILCVALFSIGCIFTEKLSTIPDVHHGYITVDEENSGNLFFWFYGSTNQKTRDTDPLIIFLQGGPGASDVMADLCEFGPYDFRCFSDQEGDVVPRVWGWNKFANILLVDSPVGAGFSYTLKSAGYRTSDEEVAEDLLLLLKNILSEEIPSLQNQDFYIISESYGGKFAAKLSRLVVESTRNNELPLNFKGIALGDTWISPLHCVKTYGSFLKSLNHVDEQEASTIDQFGLQIANLSKNEKYIEAEVELWHQEIYYMQVTKLNMFNFMLHQQYNFTRLTEYANTIFRKNFGSTIPEWVQWTNINATVRKYMRESFVIDVMSDIEYLLDQGIAVNVYQGQYDICVNVLCTLGWIYDLDWTGLGDWKNQEKNVFYSDQNNMSFKKSWKNFSLYFVEKAGHMAPMDNSFLMYKVIQDVVRQ